MTIPRRNRRVRFERPVVVTDPNYGKLPGTTWTPAFERWAEVQDVLPSKGEATTNGLRIATDASRIRVQYSPDITPDMRVVELSHRRRTLQIVGGPATIFDGRETEIAVEGYSA